jgi:hypothetical protein
VQEHERPRRAGEQPDDGLLAGGSAGDDRAGGGDPEPADERRGPRLVVFRDADDDLRGVRGDR